MKTAIQQYIDRLEDMWTNCRNGMKINYENGDQVRGAHYQSMALAYRNAISEAQQFLPIERQNIEEAYESGNTDGSFNITKYGPDYYDNRYS